MNDDDPAGTSDAELEALRSEHRDLNQRIAELTREVGGDQLEIARFKKRKLLLKDQIQRILDARIPDIIA
ncbi:MAG: YdcH family protein [Sphingomicrobium sp.]